MVYPWYACFPDPALAEKLKEDVKVAF